MVSEILEEAGVGREQLRKAQRQVLEGIVLMCQWQLERLDHDHPPPPRSRAARKVEVE